MTHTIEERLWANMNTSLVDLCAQMGIVKNRRGRWGKKMYARYQAVGRELQRLRRDGKVEYRGGPGAGWRLAPGSEQWVGAVFRRATTGGKCDVT